MSHMPGAIWVDPDDSDVTGVVNQLSSIKPGMFVCVCMCVCVHLYNCNNICVCHRVMYIRNSF